MRRAAAVAVTLAATLAGPLSVQARAPKPSPAVTKAHKEIAAEAAYVKSIYRAHHWSPPREYVDALATLSYVQGHVSAPLYGYLQQHRRRAPGSSPSQILAQGAGIGGHAAIVYRAIMKTFSVPTRQVDVFFPKGGAVLVEVWWNRAWHVVDPTFGAFFRPANASRFALLSTAQLLALSPAARRQARVGDASLLWSDTVDGVRMGSASGKDFIDWPSSKLRVKYVK
jgi:hypothetical protein